MVIAADIPSTLAEHADALPHFGAHFRLGAVGQGGLGADSSIKGDVLPVLAFENFRFIPRALHLDRFPHVHAHLDQVGQHREECPAAVEPAPQPVALDQVEDFAVGGFEEFPPVRRADHQAALGGEVVAPMDRIDAAVGGFQGPAGELQGKVFQVSDGRFDEFGLGVEIDHGLLDPEQVHHVAQDRQPDARTARARLPALSGFVQRILQL